MHQVADAVHLNLDGNRDLLFDFLGGASRPLGDHPGVLIGNIGIGFDRKLVEGDNAPDQQGHAHRQHQQPIV